MLLTEKSYSATLLKIKMYKIKMCVINKLSQRPDVSNMIQ